jgi:hypothetical protein
MLKWICGKQSCCTIYLLLCFNEPGLALSMTWGWERPELWRLSKAAKQLDIWIDDQAVKVLIPLKALKHLRLLHLQSAPVSAQVPVVVARLQSGPAPHPP